MQRILRRFERVSPALIVAMVALFVALSGTAVATTSALITGRQIANGSITGLDVKNKSLTPRDFRGSVRGPRGLRGLTGATGAKGDKGDKGDPGSSAPAGGVTSVADQGGTAITTVSPGAAVTTKTINAPGPGRVIAVATGTVYISATAGTAYLVRFKLNEGTTPNTTEDGYVAFVRDTNPTTGTRMLPFSASRVFTVGAAGPFTVNLTGWQQTGTTAQSDDTVVTLIWVPADLS